MGEQHQNAEDFVYDRASATTDLVKNLKTGLMFRAEIDGSPDAIVVATELGDDYRNVILFHVNSAADSALINEMDKVQFTLFGRSAVAQMLKRRDNAANPQTDWWAQQLTNKDA